MSGIDFFYISLGAGSLVLAGCAVVITVRIWKILGDVQSVTEDVADTTADVAQLKDGIKVAVINLVQNLLEKAKSKGGASKKHDEEEER